MKKNQKNFCIAGFFLAAFVLWTVAVRFVDVNAIGPQGTAVGFAAINSLFHNLTGVNMGLYNVTDWLSVVPIGFAAGFGCLGLAQWIKRKHLLKVDFNILALGVFYIVVAALFVLFEILEINYRPVLIDGQLEASYPSSTTLLVMCVMPTVIMWFNSRIKNCVIRRFAVWVTVVFTAFMVVGRLVSGVHWLSDIIGGILLSAGLVMMYYSVCNSERKQ